MLRHVTAAMVLLTAAAPASAQIDAPMFRQPAL